MKRKLEEKILEEIRRIVIEKDIKRQSENEKQEMREANIEALTDLTSLSREEVEKISEDVRKVFIHQLKKKRERNIRIAGVSLVLAVIAFFIFKPEPEREIKMFADDFSENKNNWSIYNDFTYKRYFENNQYIFELNNSGWCYWDKYKIDLPKNYDIEVSSSWIKGKYDQYGVGLNENNRNYYAFTIKADGNFSFGKIIDKKWVIDEPWQENITKQGKNQTNIQKTEVRDNQFKHYINDNLVKSGTIDLKINEIALRCCGEQTVAFNYVKVTDMDTKKVIFEDDFSSPKDNWEPKNEVEMHSYFKNGQFILNSNDENCHWANSSIQIKRDCELVLSSVWLEGETETYGFMIMNDDDNYYSFELKNDGNARLVERKYGEYDFVQNYLTTNFESDGNRTIDQKLIVEDGKFSYFVNDVLIKDYVPEIEFPASLSLRVCGKQMVAFEHLEIKYYE